MDERKTKAIVTALQILKESDVTISEFNEFRRKEIQDSILIRKKSENDLDTELSNVLKKLGIGMHLKGYFFICDAIKLMILDERTTTVHLYSEIINLHSGETCSKVERCIRNAIKSGWRFADEKFVNEIFAPNILLAKRKPTNSEFIASVTDYIKNN